MKKVLTDEQVEKEIARLSESEYVKLAKKEESIRYKRRQYLYCLRSYEKKGKELAEQASQWKCLSKWQKRRVNMATMSEIKQWGEEAEALVKARKVDEQAVQKITFCKKTILTKKGTKINWAEFFRVR